MPSGRRKCASVRAILGFSAENATIADCLAERRGFELPRPFALLGGGIRSEFGALLGPKKASVPGRICSPVIRLFLAGRFRRIRT